MTTERSFPYVRLRLDVSEKKQIELDPLTHSIEEVKKQSARILLEANSQNPSLKTLQPVLSGSVCLRKFNLFIYLFYLYFNINFLKFRGTSGTIRIFKSIFY